jgi:hypothetical protein
MIGGTPARVLGRRSRPAKPGTRRAAPSAVMRSATPSTQTARQQVAPRRQRVAPRRQQVAPRRQQVAPRRQQVAPRRQSSPTPPPNVRSFVIRTLSRVLAVGRSRPFSRTLRAPSAPGLKWPGRAATFREVHTLTVGDCYWTRAGCGISPWQPLRIEMGDIPLCVIPAQTIVVDRQASTPVWPRSYRGTARSVCGSRHNTARQIATASSREERSGQHAIDALAA